MTPITNVITSGPTWTRRPINTPTLLSCSRQRTQLPCPLPPNQSFLDEEPSPTSGPSIREPLQEPPTTPETSDDQIKLDKKIQKITPATKVIILIGIKTPKNANKNPKINRRPKIFLEKNMSVREWCFLSDTETDSSSDEEI